MTDEDEENYAPRTRAENEERAAEKGCVIRDPGPRELLIDLDSVDALARFERCLAVLQEFERAGYDVKSSTTQGPLSCLRHAGARRR
ncbi:MAG: hypothetical protein EPO32_14840 [Anaerolineae bacterium]|nr:MAG: hypothetical protein EPO32_14840 [Anaerolineae bacterium]